jgi:hypothetical protein
MVSFSKEISRVASSYFVQTPNYWFPMEPHLMIPFFQWLPKPLQIFLVMKINLGHSSKAESVDKAVRIIESVSLLNKKMFSELFKDAEVKYEFFFLLKKSFIAIRK